MTGGTTVDKEALKERYRAERDKRLRPDGIGQYVRLADQLGRRLEDPYMPVVPASRGPTTSPRRSSAAGSPACSPGPG